jgi:hypothetical protein
MGNFKLIHEYEPMPFMDNGAKIKIEFDAENLDDVLPQFESFLRGLGYCFDGHLEFVEDKPIGVFKEE